ncbi:MAG TPA: hypothetical protein DCP90_05250 [Clostridiales bacterium]|nr:MAG: hypothetical protein A2Y22_08955 [Clostridiales bacterium GWD2_32_59]HAN10006.1 hypothetical protein [Clostridiales bacterium]
MLKRHKLFICLFIMFIFLLNIIVSHAENNIPTISAESAIVYCINTKQILYEKNIYEKHFPASITKVMTALLAIENNKLDDRITYSSTAVNSIDRNSSHLWVVADEQITVENSLYGLLMKSANEMANGLAEKTSGSISEFVNLMNKKANDLGCINTHFENTNGLPNDNHYTTAYDMALISAEAFKSSTFREIIGTTIHTIPPTNRNVERVIGNSHKMLLNTKYHYDYCLGGKTGYTVVAGHTLVTYAEKDGMQLISVLLKSDKENLYLDATKTLDYAFNNYKLITLTEQNKAIKKLPVFQGNKIKDNISALSSQKFVFAVPSDYIESDIRVEHSIPEQFKETVAKGVKLGTIKYYYKNNVIAYTDLVSDKTVEIKPSIFDFKDGLFLGLIGLVIALVMLILKILLTLVLIIILLIIVAKMFKFKIKVKRKRKNNAILKD